MIKFLKINKKTSRRPKKWVKVVSTVGLPLLTVVVVVGVIGYFFVYRPVLAMMPSVQKLPARVTPLKDAILLQDLTMAQTELAAIDQDLLEVESNLDSISWVGSIPLAGSYFKDVVRVLTAAHHGVAVGQKVIEIITPVAGIMGFKTEGTEVEEMGMEDRIAAAASAMPQIAANLETLHPDLLAIQEEVLAINPQRYPAMLSFGNRNLRQTLIEAQSYVEGIDDLLPKIQHTLENLPGILGSPEAKKYAVIFQNDKELRPTGGFWTAYALVTMDQGKMTSLTSDDMYFVDYRIEQKTPAPPVYRQFLKIDHWFVRDSNLSPDYRVSVARFLEFWRQAQVGTTRDVRILNRQRGVLPVVDGVLALDTEVVARLLEVVGKIEVDGEGYTHENVVLELEKHVIQNKEQEGRKALIGDLMDAIFEKVFVTPKNKWDDLAALLIQLADEKHLLLYFEDEEAQAWSEDMNWAGRIRDFEGDYLQVNEANLAGAKANLYVTRTVTQRVSLAAGQPEKEVTIDFENPQAYDGLLNGPYRCYVRLLVPEGSELISVEGGQEVVPQESYFDDVLGKQVFAAFTITKTKDKSQLIFKYKLPDSVVVDGKYRLLVQKQPGHDAPSYEVTVNGETERFELRKDGEIEIEL